MQDLSRDKRAPTVPAWVGGTVGARWSRERRPPPCPTDIPVSLKTISEAWSLRLEYSFGERQWQPFAALGWTWRDTEVRSRGLGSGAWVGNDESDNGLSAELGARLHLRHGFALRVGYEWFDLRRSGGALNAGAEYAF